MAKIKTGIEKLSAATKELKKKIEEGVTVDTLGYLLDEFKDAEATLKAEGEEEEVTKTKKTVIPEVKPEVKDTTIDSSKLPKTDTPLVP